MKIFRVGKERKRCDYCDGPIGKDDGPPDGWQLDDGMTVCHACCVEDTKKNMKVYRVVTERDGETANDRNEIF